MKTFNKRGDQGETSLLYEVRVAKSDPRCEAYGTIDEAVSVLGLARALSRKKRVQETLRSLQKELFVLGSELAVPEGQYSHFAQQHQVVTTDMVQKLEDCINDLQEKMEMPRSFIIPGGAPASAAIDIARTIIRRAERRVVSLQESHLLPNEQVLSYLNRLADLLFTLARYEEKEDRE